MGSGNSISESSVAVLRISDDKAQLAGDIKMSLLLKIKFWSDSEVTLTHVLILVYYQMIVYRTAKLMFGDAIVLYNSKRWRIRN